MERKLKLKVALTNDFVREISFNIEMKLIYSTYLDTRTNSSTNEFLIQWNFLPIFLFLFYRITE